MGLEDSSRPPPARAATRLGSAHVSRRGRSNTTTTSTCTSRRWPTGATHDTLYLRMAPDPPRRRRPTGQLPRCSVRICRTGEEFGEHFVRAVLGSSWAQTELPRRYRVVQPRTYHTLPLLSFRAPSLNFPLGQAGNQTLVS